jgi:hypothetical protein
MAGCKPEKLRIEIPHIAVADVARRESAIPALIASISSLSSLPSFVPL